MRPPPASREAWLFFPPDMRGIIQRNRPPRPEQTLLTKVSERRRLYNRRMECIHGERGLARAGGPCVATVGGFDALHPGHRAVIGRLRRMAAAHGLPSVAVLFEPLPSEFFAAPPPPRLYRLRERAAQLASLGVERLVCLRFSRAIADMEAAVFIERFLVQGLAVRGLVVGHDFRFGKNREGDFAMLREAGARRGFEAEQVAAVSMDGVRISSTRIREALLAGDMDAANRLLGRRYGVAGRIVAGRGLGAQLGFPTANIACGPRPPPLAGVFAVEVEGGGSVRRGVANAGFRPTLNDAGRRWQLEAHLLDFSGDLYGRRLEVRPLFRLRDEKKFSSVEELKENIAGDILAARRWFDGGGRRAAAARA